METYTRNGIYGYDTVYVFKTLEDFDEYEKTVGKENIEKYHSNFYEFKSDFKKYINKIWEGNGNRYRIIAIEDDNSYMDWYWLAQNVDDDRDFEYLLANDPDVYKHII